MAFDNDEYWKNRKAGKRGQGEEIKPKGRMYHTANRKSQRQKLPNDPRTTKKIGVDYSSDAWKEQKEAIRARVLRQEVRSRQ